jgi:prephenate dehydratase
VPLTTVPCEAFDDILPRLQPGHATTDNPNENSLVGSIHRNYDLLLKKSLDCGRHYLYVNHHLIGMPDANMSDIKRVISHLSAGAMVFAYADRLRSSRYMIPPAVKMVRQWG